MGFFDRLPSGPDPEPDPPDPPPAPWEKPVTELGCLVPEERLLARSESAAVAVSGLRAYPNGFEFVVTAVLRGADRTGALHDRLGPRLHGGSPPPEFLRIGIRFADGAAASNLYQAPVHRTGPGPTEPLLMMVSGSSDSRRSELLHWVWPLPPPGPLTFVCEWPARGIPESYAEIDAGSVLAAAARCTPLWRRDDPAGPG